MGRLTLAKWMTVLKVRGDEELLKRLREVCRDIEAKDPTFSWREEGGDIIIYSADRDQAHRRGMWFFHKFGVRYEALPAEPGAETLVPAEEPPFLPVLDRGEILRVLRAARARMRRRRHGRKP